MIDAPGADCVVVSVTVFPWVVVVTVFPGVVTVFAGVVDGSVLDALVCPVPDEIDFVDLVRDARDGGARRTRTAAR